jgi:hypothetical protein
MAPHFSLWGKRLEDSSVAQSSTNITNAPDLPWTVIGDSRNHLLEELKKLYWEGVKCELEVILFTLKRWQQPEYSSIVLSEEDDDFIHGFDTFIDQVSQESRAFATRYGTPFSISLNPV